MHVLLLTPLYPPAVGGAASHYGLLAPVLANHSAIQHVTVLTERHPALPPLEQQHTLTIRRVLPRRISGGRRAWVAHAWLYARTQQWFAQHLVRLVRNQRIDLLQFHTRYRGSLFLNALRRCQRPVVADVHDRMTTLAPLAAQVHHLICCSEGVRAYVAAQGFPQTHTTLIPLPFVPPSPVPSTHTEAARREAHLGEEPYLLFVGDITQNKGVDVLLTAFQRWRGQHPAVQLVLAGINRRGPRFLAAFHQPGVRYLGPLPHATVLALMQDAALVVLPSRSEGLPRTMLEALALGKRVVAPPGIPEFERLLPDYVLASVDAPTLHDQLERVWHAPAPPSYPFEDHHPDGAAERLVDIYQSLIS